LKQAKKQTDTQLQEKIKFLKITIFYIEVCRNLHGNILCYAVYSLFFQAQTKEKEGKALHKQARVWSVFSKLN